jgi:hydroxyethylthiazole kinase
MPGGGAARQRFRGLFPGRERRLYPRCRFDLGVGAEVVAAARELAVARGCVVALSGERDLVTDGTVVYRIANGQPLMTRVTGMGCGLSALTEGFCAVAGEELLAATSL